MSEPERRVVVVTGGASGIGAACSAVLARQGWFVVVADIAEDPGRAVAHQVGGEFLAIDVGDEQAVEVAATRAEELHGPVRALVNSAGVIQKPLRPEDLSMETWDRVVHIDQRGTYVACLAFGRRMAARGDGGAIVNIASVAGSRSMPLHSYTPAKAAVISMTACLAAAWGRDGIRVNSVSPGYTATPALQAEIDAGRRDVSLLAGNATLPPRPPSPASTCRWIAAGSRDRHGTPMAGCPRRARGGPDARQGGSTAHQCGYRSTDCAA
jgi:NAD(P)-dependent dehydrogenase (short-subunit alcohol dehydrogenase family)